MIFYSLARGSLLFVMGLLSSILNILPPQEAPRGATLADKGKWLLPRIPAKSRKAFQGALG